MKKIIIIYFFTVCLILILSCKKNNEVVGIGSLTVVNATDGNDVLFLNNYRNGIEFKNYQQFSVYEGLNQFSIKNSETAASNLLSYQVSMSNGNTHSMYLIGPASALDVVYTKDNITPQTDSTFAVRFINLLKTGDLTINQKGSRIGSEVEKLSFKMSTGFKVYSAKKDENVRAFEVRDLSGDIIYTYQFNSESPFFNQIPRFKSVTLAIIGTLGDPSVLRINNY